MVFPAPVGVLTKDRVVAEIGAAPPWSSFRIEDPRVVRLTDHSAILTYRASAQREGQPVYSALMCSAYVERNGSWRLAFHQQTPLSGT